MHRDLPKTFTQTERSQHDHCIGIQWSCCDTQKTLFQKLQQVSRTPADLGGTHTRTGFSDSRLFTDERFVF
jgi:hypothetical protein